MPYMKKHTDTTLHDILYRFYTYAMEMLGSVHQDIL